MECALCHRSFLREHLIDGDFCIDCWEMQAE